MSRQPNPTRRDLLKASAAGLLAKPERRPNVVIYLVDQWRAQATGYAGDPNAHTPALDRLAASSANFVNAVSGCPVCSPYRGSVMTGQYPLTNGVFINDVPLVPKGPTLAQSFATAGYRTGYIGKWHLFGSPEGKYERRQAYIPPDKRLGFDYWKTCECTHNYNQSPYYEGNDPNQKVWPGYDAIAQTGDACAFIRRHARGPEPFLLMVSVGPPHNPYETAPEKYRVMYAQRPIRLRPNVPKDHQEYASKNLPGYYAHIAALDDCVARLTETIDASGAADDTILLFTSDHGDMLGCQGLQMKLYPWEESARVPFLVHYPRKLGRRGRKVMAPVDAPDIMPTLLGLAGLKIPDSVQGRDFSGLSAAPGDAALLNLAAPFSLARRNGFAAYRGLRTATHTYVRSIRGPWLLYDNRADPYQMRNLCGKPEQAALQKKLDRQLDAALRRVNDDFLPGERYLERAGLLHYREATAPVGSVTSPWGDWRSTME